MADTRPLALITGASAGIGRHLVKEFVTHGFDVVVNAEDARIADVAAELRSYGGSATPVQADLRTPEGVEQLWSVVLGLGRPLDAAALNAGIGRGKAFVDQPLEDLLSLIDLNVRSTTHLAHLVLRDMAARNAGRVLVTSSIASTMPGSFQAVYNASKSYVQSLVEALQDELRDTEVTLTSLMPGPTETEFFERGDLEDTRVGQGPQDDPADVAKQGFEALMAGERRVVAASLRTKVMEATNKVLPDRLKAAQHRKMAEPLDD